METRVFHPNSAKAKDVQYLVISAILAMPEGGWRSIARTQEGGRRCVTSVNETENTLSVTDEPWRLDQIAQVLPAIDHSYSSPKQMNRLMEMWVDAANAFGENSSTTSNLAPALESLAQSTLENLRRAVVNPFPDAGPTQIDIPLRTFNISSNDQPQSIMAKLSVNIQNLRVVANLKDQKNDWFLLRDQSYRYIFRRGRFFTGDGSVPIQGISGVVIDGRLTLQDETGLQRTF